VKRWVGNTAATIAAVAVGAVTIYASLHFLKEPQTGLNWGAALDWSVLVFSGLTTGTIAFIAVWGHFQKEPVVEGGEGR